MTVLVTIGKDAPRMGIRSVRAYVGVWGLLYDALRSVWSDPERFFDSVENRGLRVERALNVQRKRLESDLDSIRGALRGQMQKQLQFAQHQLVHTGQVAEHEVEKQVERTLERLGIPSRERLERLSNEIEALSAKIDLELARYAESET